MGLAEPSSCYFCSSVTPKPSMLASQYTCKGREPSFTASHSGKTRTGVVVSFATMSHTMAFTLGVHENLTPFLRRAVIGRIR